MSREEQIEWAAARGVPVPATKASPFSTDENLWGRSIEAGVLEDPWAAPPEEVYAWTRSVKDAPDTPREIEIGFQHGRPISLDGHEMDGVTLVQTLNQWAGEHGVGRTDLVEDRLIGIKSREIYEAPAAWTLHAAHEALGSSRLKPQLRTRTACARVRRPDYNDLWFTAHHQVLSPARSATSPRRACPQAVAIGRSRQGSTATARHLRPRRPVRPQRARHQVWACLRSRRTNLAEGEAPFSSARRSEPGKDA
jgi:argininosuccinate synthase